MRKKNKTKLSYFAAIVLSIIKTAIVLFSLLLLLTLITAFFVIVADTRYKSDRFDFKKLDDGSYMITSIDVQKTGNRIAIPSTYKGKAVTVIGRNAISLFAKGLESIEEIIIPDSVKLIESRAFQNCQNLKKVSIGGGVETIEEGAFAESYIKTLSLDPNNIHFELLNGCLCQNGNLVIGLDDATVPEGINRICAYAFSGQLIKSVRVPQTCSEIGNGAFSKCSVLEEIELPDGLHTIGAKAFYYCTKLQKIVLPDSLTEIGNVCLYGTGIKEIIVPGTEKNIPLAAFMECVNLERVVLLQGVEGISYLAFCRCIRLKELEIPSSVTVIVDCAVFATKELTLRYEGDSIPEGWEENWLAFDRYWFDDPSEYIEVDSVKLILRDGAEITLYPPSQQTR